MSELKTFEFEVQNCVRIKVKADNVEDARMMLVDDDSLYEREMMIDCYISDGRELK